MVCGHPVSVRTLLKKCYYFVRLLPLTGSIFHMARSQQIQVRVDPEQHQQIKVRADHLGVSVNTWINQVITYALTAKAKEMTVTTTRKVTL